MRSSSRFVLPLLALMTVTFTASAQDRRRAKPTFEPDKVISYKSVKGADGAADDLTLDVFLPQGHESSDQRPCVVFFFGGGWSGGTPAQFHPHCEYLASRGMVAISAVYRTKKSHGVEPKVCVFDGKSALRWVREHATTLGVDPNLVAAGGGSAGGHVAAAVAACTALEENGSEPSSSCVPNALLLFNPVYDNGPEGYGYDRVKDYWKMMSPIHNIHEGMPATIAFFGTEDKLIPVATTKRFESNMKKAGVRYDNHLYEGQGHGFFNFGRSKGEKDYFVETMREADEFLQSLNFLDGDSTIDSFVK